MTGDWNMPATKPPHRADLKPPRSLLTHAYQHRHRHLSWYACLSWLSPLPSFNLTPVAVKLGEASRRR